MNPLTQSKNTAILPVLIALMLGCFALSPQARAVCQEGCLTNANTVLGEDALINNTGFSNTAIGFNALFSNTKGTSNTATGSFALYRNTTGFYNTATGYLALHNNRTGYNNTATGFNALFSNTNGSSNTATGIYALHLNTTGGYNTANGVQALLHNKGSNNIGLGYQAGYNLTRGDYNIYIGNVGRAAEANTIRIGTQGTQTRTFIAGIRDVTTENADAITVMIDSAGQLGTMSSSRRFKKEIKPMDQTSEAVLDLRPVTFHYKSDPAGAGPQFGLIAEEVAEVNPDLVVRDKDGEIYTVRYEAVNAMLLNEFLKEHRRAEEQQATIAQLKATDAKQDEKISTLTELVKAQAAQIQKVSAQLEVKKTAPQIVLNNQ